MTHSHCLASPEWSKLLEGLDMGKIDDLVIFFWKLLVEMDKVDCIARLLSWILQICEGAR